MAGLGDMMARAQAAGGMMREGGGELPPEAGLEEELGAPPAADLEGSLAGVEAALEGLDPTDAEEARTHVNAIREIASRAESPEMPEEPVAPEGELPPAGAEGMMPPGA